MANGGQEVPQKDDSVTELDHSEKIKSQILEITGRPPRLHHLEVCRHHNGNYRVNLWQELEPLGDFNLTTRVHIGASYYLKVSDSGEIIRSNPPLSKLRFST